MAGSIYISIAFVIGVLLGRMGVLPVDTLPPGMMEYVLFGLIFFVGISIGANVEVWKIIKKMHVKIILLPLSVIIGTLAGSAAVSFVLERISFSEALAVGAGFGYYSLSSVLIAQLDGEVLGMIAMLANLMREIFTLLASPLLARFFGRLAPIAAGGATAMDTTLPVITRFCGKEYTVFAIFSGVVLTLLVPLLIPFCLAWR